MVGGTGRCSKMQRPHWPARVTWHASLRFRSIFPAKSFRFDGSFLYPNYPADRTGVFWTESGVISSAQLVFELFDDNYRTLAMLTVIGLDRRNESADARHTSSVLALRVRVRPPMDICVWSKRVNAQCLLVLMLRGSSSAANNAGPKI